MNKNNVSKKRIVDIFKKRKPVTEAGFRFFSVLLPMVEIDDEPHLLYEVRSDKVRQPGEICFPGGELEEDEDSGSRLKSFDTETEKTSETSSRFSFISLKPSSLTVPK